MQSSTNKLPTPDFMIIRVTRQDDEILFHTHGGTVNTFPAGSVCPSGYPQRPAVSVRDPNGKEVYAVPMTCDADSQLVVCLHGDGVYEWQDRVEAPLMEPVRAKVIDGEVVEFCSGEGENLRRVSPYHLQVEQVSLMNRVRNAIEESLYCIDFGGSPLKFTPAQPPMPERARCDGCGLILSFDGEICPTCEYERERFDSCVADLEGHTQTYLGQWADRWMKDGMTSRDLMGAIEMAFGRVKTDPQF